MQCTPGEVLGIRQPGRARRTGRESGKSRFAGLRSTPTEYTSTRMNGPSPQPGTPSEEIAGLVERVTFFNEESGFAVLRVKVRGHREPVTVLG